VWIPNAFVSQAGHEVLQEKTTYILGLFSHMFQICGAKPVETLDEFNEKARKVREAMESFQRAEQETFDVLELAAKRKKQQQEEREAAEAAAAAAANAANAALALEEVDAESSIDHTIFEEEAAARFAEDERLPTREREGTADSGRKTANDDNSDVRNEEEEAKLLSIQQAAIAQNRLDEKKRKHALKAERRRREEKLSREAAMAVLYEREQEAMDSRREAAELKKMAKEDSRSRHAANFFIECQIAEMSAELAKQRFSELNGYRRCSYMDFFLRKVSSQFFSAPYHREEAIKRVEEQMAKQRAQRMEDRSV
jgi:hypothetical protein